MKAPFGILITAIFLLTLTTACTKTGDGTDGMDSGHEIMFTPSFSASAVPSKAFLYDENNIIQNNKGDFSVTAYISGSKSLHFMQPERVSYWFQNWVFYDADKNADYKRYWPQTYALDFFAFMPYDLTGSNVSVDYANQQFSCTIPSDKTGQENIKEFIYAFEKEERYTEDNKGKVALEFKHPFAAVNFVLGEAHGNTAIHSVGLDNMKYTGTFDLPTGGWNLSDTKGLMNIEIGKTVGAGLQLNSLLGGPYLVLPQSTDDITISTSFTWNSTEPTTGTGIIGSGSWEPGHIYTYKLNLGDADEDIIADVSIEQWSINEYKHQIDVE